MNEDGATNAQVKEKKLDALLEYATACHIENILAEYPAENDYNSDFTLPPQFDRKMKKLIAKYQFQNLFTIKLLYKFNIKIFITLL